MDAFVKLRDEETGAVVLSFYVRAGTTVKACVPAKICQVYYGLGTEWLGFEQAFGDAGIYAKADKALDFSDPSAEYTYTFGEVSGNVTPESISRIEFC